MQLVQRPVGPYRDIPRGTPGSALRQQQLSLSRLGAQGHRLPQEAHCFRIVIRPGSALRRAIDRAEILGLVSGASSDRLSWTSRPRLRSKRLPRTDAFAKILRDPREDIV